MNIVIFTLSFLIGVKYSCLLALFSYAVLGYWSNYLNSSFLKPHQRAIRWRIEFFKDYLIVLDVMLCGKIPWCIQLKGPSKTLSVIQQHNCTRFQMFQSTGSGRFESPFLPVYKFYSAGLKRTHFKINVEIFLCLGVKFNCV